MEYRLHALGSCIQLAQPIGFNGTWAYLQAKIGLLWRDPDFLVAAVDLLEAERATHLQIGAQYARLRRQQKAAGLRFPPRSHVTPNDPARWHGDERTGAQHFLESWRRLRPDPSMAQHPAGRKVLAAVDGALSPPATATVELNELQRILDWSRRQVHVVGWEIDGNEYRIARDAYRLLGQLHLLANGPTAVATPWNFIPA